MVSIGAGANTAAAAAAAAAAKTPPPPPIVGGDTLNLSPRGKHYYPPARPITCERVLTWINFVGVVTALVLVAILLGNGTASSASNGTPAAVIARMQDQLRQLEERMEPHINVRSPRMIDSMRHNLKHTEKGGGGVVENGDDDNDDNNSRDHFADFKLVGNANTFVRWPERGPIKEFDFETLIGMQLCCHVGTVTNQQRYFVCDSGQGASDNIALECIAFHMEKEGGAHLMIYVQSRDMNGAQCTLTWQSREKKK
jgi:hypothetical protein